MSRSLTGVSASLVVACIASSASLGAQVAFRAVTRTGLFVQAAVSAQSVPANTDISSGRTVAAMWSGAEGSAAAQTQFAVTRSPRALGVTLDESGSATFAPWSLGFFFPYTHIGVPAPVPSPHSIDLELSSPVPMSVRLEVATCSGCCAYYYGTLMIPGHGAVTNQMLGPPAVARRRRSVSTSRWVQRPACSCSRRKVVVSRAASARACGSRPAGR